MTVNRAWYAVAGAARSARTNAYRARSTLSRWLSKTALDTPSSVKPPCSIDRSDGRVVDRDERLDPRQAELLDRPAGEQAHGPCRDPAAARLGQHPVADLRLGRPPAEAVQDHRARGTRRLPRRRSRARPAHRCAAAPAVGARSARARSRSCARRVGSRRRAAAADPRDRRASVGVPLLEAANADDAVAEPVARERAPARRARARRPRGGRNSSSVTRPRFSVPTRFTCASSSGVTLLRHVEPELLHLDPDRVEPALLAEDDPALLADELGRVRLDRGRIVELRRDGAGLAHEEVRRP